MLKQVIAIAALGALAAACATQPTPAAGPAPAAPAAPAAAAATATVLNIAGKSQWVSEERLLPQLPILALSTSASVNDVAGVSMTCNPDNGKITGRLAKQPATRVGQSAMYRLRVGAEATPIEGRFEASKTGDSDFVFALSGAQLRSMTNVDMASFVADTGETQWSLVKDAAAQPQAKYIGSLKNFAAESQSFLVFCNPK